MYIVTQLLVQMVLFRNKNCNQIQLKNLLDRALKGVVRDMISNYKLVGLLVIKLQ